MATHWMGPNGVDCPSSINEAVIVSTTDTQEVSCRDCLTALPKPVCMRCKGAGYDPEEVLRDPLTGAPEPVACLDCGGSGEEGPYDDDDPFF
jgi:hypothetical protein